MYAAHTLVETPPDSSVIWRFMDLAQFIDLLRGRLWFATPASLEGDDPWEGSLPDTRTKDELVRQYERTLDLADSPDPDRRREVSEHSADAHGREPYRHRYGVNCWHAVPEESAALWKIYAPRSHGIGVRSTIGAFKTAVCDPVQVYLGLVQYRPDGEASIPTGDVFARALWKRLEFGHESEVRAVVMLPENLEVALAGGTPLRGVNVAVDPKPLVLEVRVAPQARDSMVETVRDVAGRYGIQTAMVKKSALLERPPFLAPRTGRNDSR